MKFLYSPSDKIIFLILAAGLIVRVVLFFNFFDHPRFFYDDDSASYLNISENVLLGNGFVYFTEEPYTPDTHRTPGYPLFLMFHKMIFGNYYSALITQTFLSVGIAYLIFLFSKKYGNINLGYISAGVFLFMPFSLIITLKYMTQVLLAATLLLAAWTWIKFLETKENKYLIFTSILVPITVHVRPVAQYLIILFILSFFYYYRLDKNKFNRKILWTTPLILLSAFFLVLFPWQYRNYKEFGKYEMSSILWVQMYFYDIPDVYARAHNVSYEKASDILFKEILPHVKMRIDDPTPADLSSPFDSWPILKERSLAIMKESPSAVIESRVVLGFKFFIRDGIRTWFDDVNPGWRVDKNTGTITSSWKKVSLFTISILLERSFLGLLFIGMIAAFWSAFYMEPGKRFLVHFFTAIAMYFSATVGIMASALHRFQIEPFYILVGLIGLNLLLAKYKRYHLFQNSDKSKRIQT